MKGENSMKWENSIKSEFKPLFISYLIFIIGMIILITTGEPLKPKEILTVRNWIGLCMFPWVTFFLGWYSHGVYTCIHEKDKQ